MFGTQANSIAQDEKPQNTASHLGPCCLPTGISPGNETRSLAAIVSEKSTVFTFSYRKAYATNGSVNAHLTLCILFKHHFSNLRPQSSCL